MGKSERRKGHDFERKVAKEIQRIFPNARRLLEYQEGIGVDIAYTGPFQIQCKSMKQQPNVPEIFKGFKEVDANQIPVVIYKVDNKGTFAAFKYEDALNLIEIFQRSKK